MGTSNINDIKNDQGKKRSYSRQKRSHPKRSNISTTYKLFFFLLYLSVSTAILSSTSWEVVTLQHFSNLTTGYWNKKLFLEENAKINLPTLTRFKRIVSNSSPWSKKALETEFFIVILSSSVASCTFSFSKSIRLKFRGLFLKRLEGIQHCSFALKLAYQHKTWTSK